jgi:O-antigen ligase
MKALHSQRLTNLASFIEHADLIAKFYILILCLIFALPNVSVVRNLYYLVLLPMFIITVRKAELLDIVRSPVFILAALYFTIVAVASLFAPELSYKILAEHIRNSFLVLSFFAITAYLMRRDRRFPDQLILFVAVTAAVVAANNIWHFYEGLPPFHQVPRRLEGIQGLTMYYNSNWIAQLYGIVCVAAAAAATRPGTSRAVAALLVASAIVLFAAVALAQTRSVWIGVFAGLAVVIALLPREFPARRAIQIGVIVCAVLASLPFLESVLSRGDSYRLAFWKAYLSYVEAHPWAGSGLSAQLPVSAPDGFKTTHPHNMIYHALLRGGVFAATALVAFLLSILFYAIRGWQNTGSALFPALAVTALLPLQLEFTVMVGTAPGWDWLVLWMPIGLCIGAGLLGAGQPAEATRAEASA